jgi:proteic killer suppression protein
LIKSWKHKGLKQLFESGSSAKIPASLVTRAVRRMDAIDRATAPEQLDIPGFDFHRLHGTPVRYTVHVNGPVCITFGWDGTDAIDVKLEQYH